MNVISCHAVKLNKKLDDQEGIQVAPTSDVAQAAEWAVYKNSTRLRLREPPFAGVGGA